MICLRGNQPSFFMEKYGREDEDEDFDGKPNSEINAEIEGLLNKLKNYLFTYYEPVYDPKEAQVHMTTQEVYDQLFKILPNGALFSPSDVAGWLHNAGFTFFDFGTMKFEWLMKKA